MDFSAYVDGQRVSAAVILRAGAAEVQRHEPAVSFDSMQNLFVALRSISDLRLIRYSYPAPAFALVALATHKGKKHDA